MARAPRSQRGRKGKRRRTSRSKQFSGGKVRVRGHTRSPRGPDRGKKSVYVKGYRRSPPR